MKKNYDPASPIQLINGVVTTERSGIGKWGQQSKTGLIEFCMWLRNQKEGYWPPMDLSMVEIGSYAGESTIAFAMICNKVYAVDPWVNGYDPDDLSSEAIAMEQVKRSFEFRAEGYSNIEVIHSTSEEAVKRFEDGSISIVYLDSVHKIKAVRDNITLWIPKLKDGGFIAGHDFCGYWGEVVDAVLETVGLPDVRFRDGSWAKQVYH